MATPKRNHQVGLGEASRPLLGGGGRAPRIDPIDTAGPDRAARGGRCRRPRSAGSCRLAGCVRLGVVREPVGLEREVIARSRSG